MDPHSGLVTEPGHCLEGKSIAGTILVFPFAKGSTVGSYVLYGLKYHHKAPAAMVLQECEAIVAVGAIIASIPTIDQVDLEQLRDVKHATLDNEVLILA